MNKQENKEELLEQDATADSDDSCNNEVPNTTNNDVELDRQENNKQTKETAENVETECSEDTEKKEKKKENQEEQKTRENKKKRFCFSEPNIGITKMEGFLMFLILVITNLICSITISKTISTAGTDNSDTMNNLRQQIYSLEAKINDLELALSEDELDLNIDLNGEELTLTYNSSTGSIAENENAGEFSEDFDTKPFLGVGFDNVDGENGIGIKVTYVYDCSPAQFAGIKVGDIITGVNGQKISTYDNLTAIINELSAEDSLSIDIITVVDNKVEIQTIETTLTYRGNFNLE